MLVLIQVCRRANNRRHPKCSGIGEPEKRVFHTGFTAERKENGMPLIPPREVARLIP